MGEDKEIDLTGETLDGKWQVVAPIERGKDATGGVYSKCFKALRDGEEYFIKVYDLYAFLKKHPEEQTIDVLNLITEQFKYELDLSQYCRDHRANKVVTVIDSGRYYIREGELNIPFYFLVFEMADGDVRSFLRENSELELVWKLNSLHQVAVGLRQLHKLEIYHQDLKPSNILLFENDSKIGDLGRALREGSNCPFLNEKIFGDHNYLAPEISYDHEFKSKKERALLTDLYLMGSLMVYYIFNVSFNGLLYKELPDTLHFRHNNHTYAQVRESLCETASNCMMKLAGIDIPVADTLKTDIINLISALCNPDINRRHHPNAPTSPDVSILLKYGMERVVSSLDLYHRKARNDFKKGR